MRIFYCGLVSVEHPADVPELDVATEDHRSIMCKFLIARQ